VICFRRNKAINSAMNAAAYDEPRNGGTNLIQTAIMPQTRRGCNAPERRTFGHGTRTVIRGAH
jgi:hypothetical protein